GRILDTDIFNISDSKEVDSSPAGFSKAYRAFLFNWENHRFRTVLGILAFLMFLIGLVGYFSYTVLFRRSESKRAVTFVFMGIMLLGQFLLMGSQSWP